MKVLFVCTGNTCRSPMAEAIYNQYTGSSDAFSAGLAANSETISKNAWLVLNEVYDIDVVSHTARQFTPELAKNFELILTMTHVQKKALTDAFPILCDKTFVLGEYVNKPINITDPFGQNLNAYKKCAKEIEELILMLLEGTK